MLEKILNDNVDNVDALGHVKSLLQFSKHEFIQGLLIICLSLLPPFFHCDWARWANQATQARPLFPSFCPSGLRRTGTAFFRLSDV